MKIETKTLRNIAGTIREYRDRMIMEAGCRLMLHLFKKYGR